MRYYSIKDKNIKVSFKEAILGGISPDRGLYYPEKIPVLDNSFIGKNDYWHIGPFCHLDRLKEFIKIVDTKSDTNGVFISVESFSLILNKYLIEIGIKKK